MNNKNNLAENKIAVIGLGYVGLPLAVEFGKIRNVIGFDNSKIRISELNNDIDSTLEVTSKELSSSTNLKFTSNPDDIEDSDIYIVTVPTPIDVQKRPNLSFLEKSTKLIGTFLKRGNIVIYESTVYPGATEEVCVPILENISGLTFNKDFFCGYSPERINPGDKEHRLVNIRKVTSGSTPKVAHEIDDLYKSIINAGTYMAESIKVAEAAKVIENTQRDVNIALINELSVIFNRLDIDTESVLKAAGTKWNFLSFKPGLVGGHCIGVDPYYLTHKAQEVGYQPEVILAGRRINDGMGEYVVSQVAKSMIKRRIHVHGARVLILGLTFKENCPDIRNTRVVDLVSAFEEYGANVDVCDPWADPEESLDEYGVELVKDVTDDTYDAVVVAVAHDQFVKVGSKQIRKYGKEDHVLFDIKHVFGASEVDARL